MRLARSSARALLLVIVSGALASTRADAGVPLPPPDSPDMERSYEYYRPNAATGEGFVGLGFSGFTSDLGRLTTVGFGWNMRLGASFARYFGAELDYQGTGCGTSAAAIAGGAGTGIGLSSQQLTMDAKVGVPVLLHGHLLRPYAFGGGGYGHIETGAHLALFKAPAQNLGALPFGGGISYDLTRNFVLDARYTYTVLTERLGNTWCMGFDVGGKWGG